MFYVLKDLCKIHKTQCYAYPIPSFVVVKDADRHKADMPQTLAPPAPFSRPDTVECLATTPVK